MAFDYAAKIRALLAHATSAEELGNEGEAATFRAKALEWMDRYKIAEEAALAEDPTYAEPISLVVDLPFRDYTVGSSITMMARVIADHTEVRMIASPMLRGSYRITAVGYEGDIRYFEFLLTSAQLMFSTKIDPHWDSSRSDQENVFFMRQAGIKRKEIADAAGWDGDKASDRSKVQRMYLAEAKRRGEVAVATGLGFQAADYRRAYADQFVNTLHSRLRRARDAANATGGVVVLAGRAERVAEAFYQLFPSFRPTSDVQVEYVAPNADCDRCKKAKSGFCRNHDYLKPRAWTKADEDRIQRQMYGASARAGRMSGHTAAEGVVLRGTASPTARRVEASNQALEG